MTTWNAHPTHFASGDHLMFSLTNDVRSVPRVTRTNLTEAAKQAWWGDPVTVGPDQILAGH